MLSHLFRGLAERFAEWRRRQQTYDELSRLDDRSLADLGITRAEIPFVLSRKPELEAAPRAKTVKVGSVRHAS